MKFQPHFLALALVTSLIFASSHAQVFTEQYTIISDEPSQWDDFGDIISIDGGIIATSRSGSTITSLVYLYEESTGNLVRTLLPVDNDPSDLFGFSVVIKDGIVAVGAPQHNGAGGAVYLFDANTGNQISILVADDAAPGKGFGSSVAISNGTLAIGSMSDDPNGTWSGSVYIFDIATGNQLRKIVPNDGGIFGLFGKNLAMSGDTIAISSSGDGLTFSLGAVYLFDAISGTQLHKLRPVDVVAGNGVYGSSISIDNNIIAVGSSADDDSGENAGAVYLFDAVTGNLIRKILPATGVVDGEFGFSVAIRNNLIAIGSINDIVNGQVPGSVHLFDMNSGEEYAQLIPSDPDDNHIFGRSIALSDDSIVVGTRLDDSHGHTGSMFVFSNISCSADLNNDGALDFNDISLFLILFGTSDPVGDFNGDGDFDFFDVSAFLNNFAAGCP